MPLARFARPPRRARFARGFVLLGLVALVAARPAPQTVVGWSPERPSQGDLFTVRVAASDRDIASVRGQAGDEPLQFWRDEDGAFRSLAPMPVSADGSLSLTVTVRYATGGEESFSREVPVSAGAFEHERLTVAPEFGAPLDSIRQARLDRDRAKAARVSRDARATPRLWTPLVVLPRDDRVTSGFGNGRIFNGQVSSRHMGLDLDGDRGDTVVAATRGVVALVDEFLLAGNIVYLNHGSGLLSGYFHLSEQLVSEGDSVEAGTPIGRVGATGRVTGPHLHWVVRYGSTSVDPRSLVRVVGRRPTG
jgi:murein DD-endopeptidase MepM/ murein hydrolase activator NlpD